MEPTLVASPANEEVVPASLADGQPFVLTGQLGLDQLLRIERIKARILRPLSTLALGVSFCFVLLPGVAMTLWLTEASFIQSVGTLGQFVFIGLLLLGFIWGKPCFDAWRLRRRYQSGELQPEQIAWKFTADSLEMISDNIEARDAWGQLAFVGEGEEMLVLRNRGGYRLYCLPREFATEEDWNRLREVVRSRPARALAALHGAD